MDLTEEHSRTVTYKGEVLQLPLFLDNQSTTPVARQVQEVIKSTFATPGNAASRTHIFGVQATQKIETARKQVAALINAHPDEIFFTSSATEANRIALKEFVYSLGTKGQIISLMTEHNSVLNPLEQLKKEGYEVILLPVQKNGLLDLDLLEKTLSSSTALVSIQAANSEIGTLQDIDKIAALSHSRNIPFHTDAVQAAGTQRIDTSKHGITLLSLSAHKLYGPQGVGALYVRRECRFKPVLETSTPPTALIAGFGEACRLSIQKKQEENLRLLKMSKQFISRLKDKLGQDIWINGHLELRIPGCLSIGFRGIEAEDLLFNMSALALSTGSACNSASNAPSTVLKALGVSSIDASSVIRVGLGRYVTEIEADYAANLLAQTYIEMKRP